MEYLSNPFNMSINPPPEPTFATYFGFGAIYSAIYYMSLLLIDNHYNQIDKLDNYAFKIGNRKTIIENKYIPEYAIKLLLDKYLNVNSLDRAFLLYYIFEEKGDYETSYMDEKLQIHTIKNNCWEQFKALERYFGKEKFNLDENADKNITIKFGNDTYNLNIANLRFISWLYYSGLSAYLLDNEELKYNTLNYMNELKLLRGNLFLRYQYYLIEYEECYNNENPDNSNSSDDLEIIEPKMEVEYNDDKYDNEYPDISDIDNMLNRYYVLGKLIDNVNEIIFGKTKKNS